MPDSMTAAMSARIAAVGAVPVEQDLYAGAGVDFYDRLVGSDRAEIREVLALARRVDGPILDVAAGSGRLTIPLVRSGRTVTAVDLSDDMLSRLRAVVPDGPLLECVVADMRDLALGRRYGLVVLGATSITLLDREGRSRLYTGVRRHLAPGGVFALTIAGGVSAQALAASGEQEIRVPGPAGEETYLFAQEVDDDGAARVVNWVRATDLVRGREATILTSRLRVLGQAELARELVDAGFAAPVVSPVRADRGQDIRLLTTTMSAADSEADADE